MSVAKILSLGGAGVVALVLFFTVVFGSWYTVDQGETGVLLTNGAVSGTEQAGLHFKFPFVNSVAYVSTQSHFEEFKDMDSYTKDQQDSLIQATINYHVPKGQETDLYARYGSVDIMVYRVLDQKFPAIFKDVLGQYNAQDAIQNRAKLNSDTLTAIQNAVQGEPVVIESVQIKDIKYSPAYEQSIEAKQQATVEVQKQTQLLAQEQVKAQIAVTQAQGLADARIAAAKAEAQAIELKGNADAAVIESRGKALKDNPDLVKLIAAQQWDGKLPVTMVPGSAVPFVDVPTPSATQ